MSKVIRDTRTIPVNIFVDGVFLGPAKARILIDEDDEISEQLITPDGRGDLVDVDPRRIACQILKPLDAIAYLGSKYPDLIGRDE